ncbi:MAG: hypothetical protein H6670_17910 [Anaerolineaceae bacterium]|nr:hypothetical protein [Anaerolineaceae bacterium]
MSRLGLEILPSLKSGDLVVNTPEALSRLKQEAKIIQENLVIIMQETNVTEQTVIGSTSNIIEAVELAEANNGFVTIS